MSFQFPNKIGEKIARLKPGDQIIVLFGEGYPATTKDTVDIIWKVDGYSALTAGGIIMSSQNLSDVIPTGNYFEDFLVSSEAKAIWIRIHDDIEPEFFDNEPE